MPIVTGIALTHQFNAPLGWSSCEYGQGRQYHGFVYLMEGEATYLFIDGSKL